MNCFEINHLSFEKRLKLCTSHSFKDKHFFIYFYIDPQFHMKPVDFAVINFTFEKFFFFFDMDTPSQTPDFWLWIHWKYFWITQLRFVLKKKIIQWKEENCHKSAMFTQSSIFSFNNVGLIKYHRSIYNNFIQNSVE